MLKKIWKRLKADYTPKSVEVLRKGYVWHCLNAIVFLV